RRPDAGSGAQRFFHQVRAARLELQRPLVELQQNALPPFEGDRGAQHEPASVSGGEQTVEHFMAEVRYSKTRLDGVVQERRALRFRQRHTGLVQRYGDTARMELLRRECDPNEG